MKKSYLMIAAAAALLAACSSNDTFKEADTQDVRIGFSSTYIAKQTKAEITDTWLTDANVTEPGFEFGVFGYKYAEDANNTITLFNNERVYFDNNDWKHNTTRYWDKSATNAYYFYAYAPYADNSVVTFTRTGSGETGFTYNLGEQVFADATLTTPTNTIDLCVARQEGVGYRLASANETYTSTGHATAQDGHIAFSFKHVLSKLTFRVRYGDRIAQGHDVYLNSIEVGFPTAAGATWTQNSKSAPANSAKEGYITYSNLSQPTTTSPILSNVNQQVYNAISTEHPGWITGVNSYIVTPNEIVTPTAQTHTIKLKVGYTIDYNDTNNDNTDAKDPQTATGDYSLTFEEDTHYILTIIINPETIEFDVDEVKDFTTDDTNEAEVK